MEEQAQYGGSNGAAADAAAELAVARALDLVKELPP
jgi:hypothetical protein